jgi:hypothetical protein
MLWRVRIAEPDVWLVEMCDHARNRDQMLSIANPITAKNTVILIPNARDAGMLIACMVWPCFQMGIDTRAGLEDSWHGAAFANGKGRYHNTWVCALWWC